MSARFIVGPSLAALRSMPDASVDLVLTSSPFLALRSYLAADHPDKALEVGSEPTPGAFIDALLDHTEECRRVLAPHGSLVWELGDTYAGSGGAGGDWIEGSGQRVYKKGLVLPEKFMQQKGDGWPLDKSLCLIPELLRFALAYGFNPLTGRQTPRWRVRNVIRWCRPNPPVGALADKVRPATSELLVACVSRKRYFDLDAIRTPHQNRDPYMINPSLKRYSKPGGRGSGCGKGSDDEGGPTCGGNNAVGSPPLDHWWHDEDTFDRDAWLIPTAPYKGAHYATWPPDLLVKPILAMCPQLVCTTCGKPSERITESTKGYAEHLAAKAGRKLLPVGERSNTVTGQHRDAEVLTTGWTDCGHDTWRPGVVLDPFAGTGTTLAVATGHGRDAIGIDIDDRNADLARERVGMFLEVEHHQAVVA